MNTNKAHIIFGCNGAGKTTFYNLLLKKELENIPYINNDILSRELQDKGMSRSEANKVASLDSINKLKENLANNKDVVFETLFYDNSENGTLSLINDFKNAGYEINGYFVHTNDVNINIENIENRVKSGLGNSVSTENIKDRYVKILENLHNNLNLFDKLKVIDNSDFKKQPFLEYDFNKDFINTININSIFTKKEENLTQKKITFDEQIANNIIEALENGTAPWQKPWKGIELKQISPTNYMTGKQYQGLNYLNLLMATIKNGYVDNRWLTFKQGQELGGFVKKGEKGVTVRFYQDKKMIDELDEKGKVIKNEDGSTKKITIDLEHPICTYKTVFNASQFLNLPIQETIINNDENINFNDIETAEQILKNSGADIEHKVNGYRAFYNPMNDQITLPPKESFFDEISYYSTALHELGHWTGHSSRLDRDLSHSFGTKGYAKEELKAEIASLMICTKLGLDFDPGQHYAYVSDWVSILKEKPNEISLATKDANLITNYVIGLSMEKEQKIEQKIEIKEVFEEKTYLAVPYSKKDIAKKGGAEYDQNLKCWFAPKGANKDLLSPFIIENQKSLLPQNEVSYTNNQDYTSIFYKALTDYGLIIDSLELDGNKHRVSINNGKPGNKDGWYVGFLSGTPTLIYGDWKNQETQKLVHRAEGDLKQNYDPTKTEIYKAIQQAELSQKTYKQNIDYLITSELLKEEYNNAKNAPKNHPYLEKKGIQADDGIKIDARGNLLIPIRDIQGKIWAVQRIGENGFKMIGYLKNAEEKENKILHPAKKDGNFYIIGSDKLDRVKTVIVVEGYATGSSISEAYNGYPVVVAFDCGNIEKVVSNIQKEFPQKDIIIAGDNDVKRELKGEKNVGKEHAILVSEKFNIPYVLPKFTSDEIAKGYSDFNDLHKSRGLEEIKNQISPILKEYKDNKQNIQHSQEQNLNQQKILKREVIRKASLNI